MKTLRSIYARHILLSGLIMLPMLSPLTHAQEISADFSGGSVEIGYDSRTCDASLEGAIRYNSSITNIEYCDSSTWQIWGG